MPTEGNFVTTQMPKTSVMHLLNLSLNQSILFNLVKENEG